MKYLNRFNESDSVKTWYDIKVDILIPMTNREMFEDIPYTPYLAKKITDIFLGKGLWITRKEVNPKRIAINRKLQGNSNNASYDNLNHCDIKWCVFII